jgi:hypothetical protein
MSSTNYIIVPKLSRNRGLRNIGLMIMISNWDRWTSFSTLLSKPQQLGTSD